MEILPGAIFHAVTDVKPETIAAMRELVTIVRNMSDEELKNVEDYAKFLGAKHKKKRGRRKSR